VILLRIVTRQNTENYIAVQNMTLQDCQARDATHALRALRELFLIPAGVIYLDGNSLGVLPKAAPARIAQVVEREWGQGLIRSWNDAGWFNMPQRLGDKLAPWIGANAGEVVVADSTSVNLYKVLHAALTIARARDPKRTTIVSERSNFPTDNYIAEGLARERGFTLKLVLAEEIVAALDSETAMLMLTQVNYRTGAMHDMRVVSAAATKAGALTVWDLAHSAGAVEVNLNAAGADFAVGCGYKYLNGGPGAPAFLWVHPRHQDQAVQPLTGWYGHVAPFAFTPHYAPVKGISQYLCGTPPVISTAALECGLDGFEASLSHGGMAALREKSLALTDLFILLVEARCAGHNFALITPREHSKRGSQICLNHPTHGYAIMQAMIARGVIGDYRKGDAQTPDIIRFGFAPLYIGFEDIWNAVEHLRCVMDDREYLRAEFNAVKAVT
jgi:kynureninase